MSGVHERKYTLAELRARFSLTQDQLAIQLGFRQSAVSNWENGYSEPHMKTARRVAEFFGVPLGSIVFDSRRRPA